jgi:hypothetical protein
MNFNLFLAGFVLAVHLLFILWVIFGWLFTRRSPRRRWLHIGCLVYAIFIEASNLSCPLTLLESLLEQHGGIAPYHEPFILHYLELLVYPNIPVRAGGKEHQFCRFDEQRPHGRGGGTTL